MEKVAGSSWKLTCSLSPRSRSDQWLQRLRVSSLVFFSLRIACFDGHGRLTLSLQWKARDSYDSTNQYLVEEACFLTVLVLASRTKALFFSNELLRSKVTCKSFNNSLKDKILSCLPQFLMTLKTRLRLSLNSVPRNLISQIQWFGTGNQIKRKVIITTFKWLLLRFA